MATNSTNSSLVKTKTPEPPPPSPRGEQDDPHMSDVARKIGQLLDLLHSSPSPISQTKRTHNKCCRIL